MNERIQKLMEQAIILEDDELFVREVFDREKFAELIVRECAEISINDEIDPCDDIRTGIANKIKKHFGVEE